MRQLRDAVHFVVQGGQHGWELGITSHGWEPGNTSHPCTWDYVGCVQHGGQLRVTRLRFW